MRRSLSALTISVLLVTTAAAQDLSVHDWSGFYAGIFAGYGIGQSSNDWSTDGTVWIPDGDIAYQAPIGGALAGYQAHIDNFVLGGEADLSLGRLVGDDAQFAGRLNQIEIDGVGTVRARAGVAFDNLLVFGTAGMAAASFTKSDQDGGSPATPQLALGWTAGGGIEFALGPQWAVRAEYQHIGLSSAVTAIDVGGGSYMHRANAPAIDVARLGLTYSF